ncbi:uncharacterized protein [Battus philenor]|uniref:uncharacterized protein isoform X2 n=1 Tax=Battus philenor TaxID=42288 RepID=UPI0035CF3EB9
MKWFLASFLICWARFAVGSELPELVETKPSVVQCLAGTEWESHCHLCQCLPDGTAKCWRQEPCDTSTPAEPIPCKPNTVFYRDCNSCICLSNGEALCSATSCRESNIPKKSDLLSGKECSPGSEWTSQCNECHCTAEGYSSCTEMKCPGQEDERVLRCAPDTVWMNDCNTCWCTSEGRAMCTRMGCNALPGLDLQVDVSDKETSKPESSASLSRKTRASLQEAPKACQPGQEFRMDCNKCLCDNEGQDFSCTRIDCNALNNNNNGGSRSKRETTEEISTTCTAGSVFRQSCNVCRCSADGLHATCTTHDCEATDTYDGFNAPDSDPNFRCNPGEQFKHDCNDCTCSADGKSVFCTLLLCSMYKP